MSVRKILNKTSQKKSDTMLTWTNIRPDSAPDDESYTPGSAKFSGDPGTFHITVFCPTARGLEDFSGALGSKANRTIRTSTTVFARGYKESVQLATQSGRGWQWRRICFTMKGDALNQGNSDPTTSGVFREISSGYQRLLKRDDSSRPQDLLFRGTQNVDWNDPLYASLDTRKILVKYDRLTHIRSGNADGVTRTYKLWHPMNKNIYYEDDETGNVMNSNPFSVENKQGMGDYYIVDIFKSNLGSSPSDTLDFDCNGTYFWHEK